MDVLEPFLLDFDNSRNLNISEIDREIIRLNEQRKIAAQVLRSELPLEYLLDCVADFGVDSYEYLDIVSDNIDSIICNETPIENSSLILL